MDHFNSISYDLCFLDRRLLSEVVMTAISEQTLRRLWPRGDSKVPGLVAGIAASSEAVFKKYGLTTPTAVAQAMAQFSEECGAGTEMEENMNYSAERIAQVWPSRFSSAAAAQPYAHAPQKLADNVYGSRMGNHPGTDDGYNFRGRGLSQVTGREGYQKLGAKLGLDLISNPGLVNSPSRALEAAVADFVICGCLPYALADDIVNVTKKLNGGTIGLADRETWLPRWKAALATQGPQVAIGPTPAHAGGAAAGGAGGALAAHQAGLNLGWVIAVGVACAVLGALVAHFLSAKAVTPAPVPVPPPVVSPPEVPAPASPTPEPAPPTTPSKGG